MNDFAIKVLNSGVGKTSLFFVGQAGFIIKSKSGKLLGIDLYLSDCVERVEGHKGYKRLLPKILRPDDLIFDAIIASHAHKDHFDNDSIPFLLGNERTVLYASVGCRADVQKLNLDSSNIVYVCPGDKFIRDDFEICFINCDHGISAPDAVGVVIKVDGKTILEIGDTCLRLDWIDMYKKLGYIDVLIAPINGMYGNTTAEDCAVLADLLKPKVVIPCHYGMFASHMGSPGAFYDIMTKKFPENDFVIMCQGERIDL